MTPVKVLRGKGWDGPEVGDAEADVYVGRGTEQVQLILQIDVDGKTLRVVLDPLRDMLLRDAERLPTAREAYLVGQRSDPEQRILTTLSAGPLTVYDIAARLDLDVGAVLRWLRALEHAGFVRQYEQESGVFPFARVAAAVLSPHYNTERAVAEKTLTSEEHMTETDPKLEVHPVVQKVLQIHVQNQQTLRTATLAWLEKRELFDDLQREVLLIRLRGEPVSDDLGMRSLRSMHELQDTQAEMDAALQRVSDNNHALGRMVSAIRAGQDPAEALSPRWRVRAEIQDVVAWVVEKDQVDPAKKE